MMMVIHKLTFFYISLQNSYLFTHKLQTSNTRCFVWHNPDGNFSGGNKDFPTGFFSSSLGAANLTLRFVCLELVSESLFPLPRLLSFVVAFAVVLTLVFGCRASLCEVNVTLGLVLCFLVTWPFLLLSGDSCLAFFPSEDLVYLPALK